MTKPRGITWLEEQTDQQLDGLTDERAPTTAIDEAINALQRARDQLTIAGCG